MRAAVAAALCASVLLACAPGAWGAHAKRRRAPALTPVSVSYSTATPGPQVPRGFLGLSYELSSLRQVAGYANDGDLVALLRSLGTGVLRFGGVSADTRVAWSDQATPRPSWASSAIEPADLRQLAQLAADSGWKVLLTIGFGHFEPQAAAREAAAAKAAMGESLEGIELGNEPNAYALHGLRSEPWTFVQYDEQVQIYRAAIEAAAPGIPLVGPDTSGSSAYENWGLGEAVDQRPALLTGHHYPLGCEQRPAPSIALLLSPETRRLEKMSLRRYVSIARQGQIPFRMDETNSVSCGGVAGISNTFASALWATGYVAQAMSMGVSGINMHGNPSNCAGYTPVCARTPEAGAVGRLSAQPEWYALLLARALVGERPLQTGLISGGNANVSVSTFLDPGGALRFVAVDYDSPGARRVALSLPVGTGFGGASVLSLTARAPTSLSGVRLGGRAVASDGWWTPPATLPHVASRGGVVTVALAPGSAALVTVSPTVE